MKSDFIVCATMVMLCCRTMLFDDALAACDDIASCDLTLTYQQHCYICSHIVGCFVKLESFKDRKSQIASIARLLSFMIDSDIKDVAKDTLTDVSVYLDLLHGLRALDKVLKLFPDIQHTLLLQRCISSVECRIPPGRNRTSSMSSAQSYHSSNSSSRATSPLPSPCIESVPAREVSIAELRLTEPMVDPRHSELSISADKSLVQPSAALVCGTKAPYSYGFIPCSPLPPDSSRLLTREIGEVCEEFHLTDADRSVRAELIREIDRVVGKWNPAFKVALYGSFSTGLCDRDSDLDLLIATPAALSYMQSHNFYEPTTVPPPPLPPVMLDDLFILIQTDPSLKKRHERPPRLVVCVTYFPSQLIRLQLHCRQCTRYQTSS